MRTERRRGDRPPIHLVWAANNLSTVCGEEYPRLRIPVDTKDTHPVLINDPLFCDACVKGIKKGVKAPPRRKQERGKMW